MRVLTDPSQEMAVRSGRRSGRGRALSELLLLRRDCVSCFVQCVAAATPHIGQCRESMPFAHLHSRSRETGDSMIWEGAWAEVAGRVGLTLILEEGDRV